MTSIIIMVIIGLMSLKTCQLQITHFKLTEIDFQQALKRVLGRKWELAYIISTIAILYIAGMIYFLLAANTIYPLMQYIFKKDGKNRFPEPNKFVLNEFSF